VISFSWLALSFWSAIGGYLSYTLIPHIGFWGALAVAPVLTAVLGLIVERVLHA